MKKEYMKPEASVTILSGKDLITSSVDDSKSLLDNLIIDDFS